MEGFQFPYQSKPEERRWWEFSRERMTRSSYNWRERERDSHSAGERRTETRPRNWNRKASLSLFQVAMFSRSSFRISVLCQSARVHGIKKLSSNLRRLGDESFVVASTKLSTSEIILRTFDSVWMVSC
ncbi:hypothetical protein BT93_B0840 [Corymbia citriodora subsp. variegata]|nr:hypothetical protein BT93_B0840 [Corymbia citriodora subsp. variegata]